MQRKVGLVSQTYAKNLIGEFVPYETTTIVWADIRSMNGSAWADAGVLGIKGEFEAYMPRVNYHGEKVLTLDGKRYSVYRTYEVDEDEIELYLTEDTGVTHGQ